jgi:hypothetical protein
MKRFVLAALTALMLVGCGPRIVASPPPAPQLVEPDSVLTKNCRGPSTLPEGAMPQEDIERYWIQDRVSLIECASRFGGLRDFYAKRDAGLRGPEPTP